MPRHAKDLELVLHIGLHKTATTYLQNVLSARRYDLVQHGLLYPNTGTTEEVRIRTREGAQSGHSLFTYGDRRKPLITDLRNEIPPTASTVLLSSEDFTHPRLSPAQHLELFSTFGTVRVVVVVRRQDQWIESLYKQAVDQYGKFETRSFADYLAQEGPSLLDLYALLTPWRELVGPDSFHVLSYDDLADGDEICRRVLGVAGIDADVLGEFPGVEVPRYQSVRSLDTIGLRILNGYRLPERDLRNKVAKEIYKAAPSGDITLMTAAMRAGIIERCAAVNERIESEWLDEPAPAFRFGKGSSDKPVESVSGVAMVEYVDQVLALCEAARAAGDGAAG